MRARAVVVTFVRHFRSEARTPSAFGTSPKSNWGSSDLGRLGLGRGQNPFTFNQFKIYSANSCHPLSMVNEWPRLGNSLYSVTAGDLPYAFSALRTSTGGTVLSFKPEMSNSGPRFAFVKLTFVAELGLKVAVAAWNSGRPGAGIAYIAYNCFASCSETALVKPKRNCCSVNDTARLKLKGFPSTGNEDFRADKGNSGTPLIGAGSMAMAAL